MMRQRAYHPSEVKIQGLIPFIFMLKRQQRLSKKKDFENIFRTGYFFYGKALGIKFKDNGLSFSRFAVIINSKVSKKAVTRNRLRRQIGEIIRLNLVEIKIGYDIIIIVRPGLVDEKFPKIKQSLIELFKKAKLYG